MNKLFLMAVNRVMVQTGHMMKGGTIVDATIINDPSSTKNAEKKRDPEMHKTKKGIEWKFGMKCHIGVDADSGLVHSMTVTAANKHDITETVNLLREDDEVAYGDSGYLGVQKRPEIASNEHFSKIDFRINRRPAAFLMSATTLSIGNVILKIANPQFGAKWSTPSELSNVSLATGTQCTVD